MVKRARMKKAGKNGLSDKVRIKRINGFVVKAFYKQEKFGDYKAVDLFPYRYEVNGKKFKTGGEVSEYLRKKRQVV